MEILNFTTRNAGIYYVAVISSDGYDSDQSYSLTIDSTSLAPGTIVASKVYPNPGPGSKDGIWFDYKLLASVEKLTLDIYTLTGTLVHTQSTLSLKRTGQFFWNAMTETGESVASGVYIYVMKAELNGKTDAKTGKIAIIH